VGQSLTVSDSTQKALRTHTIPTSKLVNVVKDDSAQAHIYKAWMAPPVDSDDTYAISVMNTLFGGAGLSARLFLELRDKQGLAYSVRSSFDAYRYSGLYKIYIGTEPSNKDKCLVGFETECGKLINELVSAQELAETKTNMLGRRQVFLETSSQWAAYVGGSLAQGRTLAQLAEYEDRILSVTSADIQRVSQQIFNSANVISIVGPSSIF
jgi:predicted Zn-dependent peptidase